MKPPRGLSPEEAELWARVARTVSPLAGRRMPPVPEAGQTAPLRPAPALARPVPASVRGAGFSVSATPDRGLDSHWDRKLAKGAVVPDFTLDLHGASLGAAYARLAQGLAQARAMGARLVLVITGKPRPADAADRGNRRGAIRAQLLDWLAAGEHAPAIAAIRPAHRRHGGPGSLYIVLRRAL